MTPVKPPSLADLADLPDVADQVRMVLAVHVAHAATARGDAVTVLTWSGTRRSVARHCAMPGGCGRSRDGP
jgi:hypothetical protein